MHNKIHSVISPLFRIKNADTETGWNVQILRSVWIISAEIRYLLSGQKKFQNKSKNIDEVYQSVFFRCIMFLSYRVTFLCNVLGQIHYTSESPVRYFFYEKVVKWCHNTFPTFLPKGILPPLSSPLQKEYPAADRHRYNQTTRDFLYHLFQYTLPDTAQ